MEELTVLNQISFWLFAALMIGGALGVVFHRSIVYSALLLLVTFLSIAGFFVMLNAPFIAAAQILVYGVGLTIVLIFGIMLTGDKPFVDPIGQERPNRYWIVPGIAAAAVLGFLVWALLYPNYQFTAINGLFISHMDASLSKADLPGLQAIIADGGITHIGLLLFSKYLVPFELASILLLLAVIGAIILSKKEFPEEEGEAPLRGLRYDEPPGVESSSCDASSSAEGTTLSSSGAAAKDDKEIETLGVH